MGDFDDSEHPRDDEGRFTDGRSSSTASKRARANTKMAAQMSTQALANKPKVDASSDAHRTHANGLLAASKRHLTAAQAHNEAAEAASKAGNPERAIQHAEAVKLHVQASRTLRSEAHEHNALARTNAPPEKKEHENAKSDDHAKESADQAKKGHEEGKDADKHEHDESAKHDKDHEGSAHKGHEGGIAHWVAEKLEHVKEAVHEGGEHLREFQEKAIEGDPLEVGKEIGASVLKFTSKKLIPGANIAHTVLTHIGKGGKKHEGEHE